MPKLRSLFVDLFDASKEVVVGWMKELKDELFPPKHSYGPRPDIERVHKQFYDTYCSWKHRTDGENCLFSGAEFTGTPWMTNAEGGVIGIYDGQTFTIIRLRVEAASNDEEFLGRASHGMYVSIYVQNKEMFNGDVVDLMRGGIVLGRSILLKERVAVSVRLKMSPGVVSELKAHASPGPGHLWLQVRVHLEGILSRSLR